MKTIFLNKITMSNFMWLICMFIANEAQAGFIRDSSMSVMLGVNTENGVLKSKVGPGNFTPELTIVSEVVLVKKVDFVVHEFEITQAGSYIASLRDFEIPGSLNNLNLQIHQAGSSLGVLSNPLNQNGTQEFNLVAGLYIATLDVSTGSNGLSSYGLYGFEIGSTAVPLPGALFFFLSGLTFLGFYTRRRQLL